MAVPVSQMWTVASYVLRQKLAGRKRYPLVLMLEPLFRCNLACAGCGKIQYPAHILKTDLSPEDCFKAVDECGAPMVSIPGGEPLMHPQIAEIVEGLVGAQEIYLSLHQRAAAARKAAPVQAQQVSELFRCTWTARKSTTIFRCAAKADTKSRSTASAPPSQPASA
jgi:hopanoid biosynthesis associated radical SAM protein HpnH